MTLAMVAAAGLASCSFAKQVMPADERPGEYVIGREDSLEVSVWRDGDLTRTVPVRPDGKISLPLIGEVEAAGKTARELSRELSKKLVPFVQDPRVVVIVREINAPRFFVIGEVARPGAFPLRARTTLLQALSLAGGFNEFADRGAIVVVRGSDERFRVDYADILKGKGDIGLWPGDTVYVP